MTFNFLLLSINCLGVTEKEGQIATSFFILIRIRIPRNDGIKKKRHTLLHGVPQNYLSTNATLIICW